MRGTAIMLLCLLVSAGAMAQENNDKGKFKVYEKGEGFYYESILKDVKDVDEKLNEEEPYKRFVMDQSGFDLPNNPELYKTAWAEGTISQGNAGTCWCFSTSSLYESEIFRQTGKQVKLSEIYTVYWEYVEKARRFIE